MDIGAKPADPVLTGIHCANNSGAEATSPLLGMHPRAMIMVFGSSTEIDVLAADFICGARRILLGTPDQPRRQVASHGRTTG